jgi:hypothetical protein
MLTDGQKDRLLAMTIRELIDAVIAPNGYERNAVLELCFDTIIDEWLECERRQAETDASCAF